MEGKRKVSQDVNCHQGDTISEARVLQLLKKAETILAQRTDRLLLVLERPLITENYLG